MYDSKDDTMEHRKNVQLLLSDILIKLDKRGLVHDESKLHPPEKVIFDVVTPRLKKLTYGSSEYKKSLQEMGGALSHHYEANSHHPEHWPNGILDMSLIDLIEMLADWKAATLRHADGDMNKSLEINKDRFSIPKSLTQIFKNTIKELQW